MKIVFLLIGLLSVLNANISDAELKKMIGQMLIVGFDGKNVDKNSQIVKDINSYNLGGVILFDKDYKHKDKTKNISSKIQLKKLINNLKRYTNKDIFISVDQEGGFVARLKPKYGFDDIKSAQDISMGTLKDASYVYNKEALMLNEVGINMNFAPVVDLAVNPQNKVIVGLKRSYGSDVKKVVSFASIVIEKQTSHNIISVLKHFPGHGSSLGDSHKGFVNISDTWSFNELEPYYQLIKDGKVDAIMSAHVFNSHIDDKYPATLSYKFNTILLREVIGYKGVIISDDMQMGALSKHYSLDERVRLAINSGVDILLFGNQLSFIGVRELVESIFHQVKDKKIMLKRIIDANKRISYLKTKNSIIKKPIIFEKLRIDMTKSYMKKHYGIDAKNITIVPKMIVLHWTAVSNFKDSFKRLYPQKLLSDRADIVNASVLNVSAHFLVDKDGTIYQLMKDNDMARHVIGLNYSSIGIENVGGEGNKKEDLTQAQVKANIKLVKYLKQKYPTIKYLIGHYEYMNMQDTPLWLEKDKNYRTQKVDPGEKFMKEVRIGVRKCGFLDADK